jgi:FKBP-type peptidyl-prolyl cis-trans isomerase FkpA
MPKSSVIVFLKELAMKLLRFATILLFPLIPFITGCATMTPPDLAKLNLYDIKAGDGTESVRGRPAAVHYTGWLFDASKPDYKGKQFDSSRTRGQPFTFTPGAGQVIRGWEDGVPGMKVGGQRLLIIPPEMGYGTRGAGGGLIPPNAVLVFEVELMDVR